MELTLLSRKLDAIEIDKIAKLCYKDGNAKTDRGVS
jgi:hypothetical protein